MTDGVFTIHVERHGRTSDQRRRDAVSGLALRRYIGDDENRLIESAIDLLGRPCIHPQPVVFFGPTGTGKTLLLDLIADRWKAEHPDEQIVCTSGHQFARDYASAVETDSVDELLSNLRSADFVVIDDIHQLGENTSVIRALNRSIDILIENRLPIVVAMLESPATSADLDPALASRLCDGLTVPVVSPGRAARREIVRRLADLYEIELSNDGLHDLLKSIQRRLPSATAMQLNSVMVQLLASVQNDPKPIDSKRIARVLRDLTNAQSVSIPVITQVVSRFFEIKTSELKGPSRRQNVVTARGIAMLLARELTDSSLEQIGHFFGKRDHTTVLHACRKTSLRRDNDPATRRVFDQLTAQLDITSTSPS